MDIIQTIHVTDYTLDGSGIRIDYRLTSKPTETYHYLVPISEAAEVLAKIGTTISEGLCQQEAILLVAAHELEKREKKVQRVKSDFDLVEYSQGYVNKLLNATV